MAEQNPSPKHGTISQTQDKSKKSVSQADGTGAQDPKGETQPSSSDGPNPGTAGKKHVPVKGQTPENRHREINPSAPTAGTEGGINKLGAQFASEGDPTIDAAGETGTQSGKGTLEVNEQNLSERNNGQRDGGKVEREFPGEKAGRSEEDIEGAA